MKIEIEFTEEIDGFEKFTDENQKTYFLDMKEAVRYFKENKAKRHYKKRECGCRK